MILRPAAFIVFCFWLSSAFSQMSGTVSHTLFLVGDAGEPYVKDEPFGKVLRRHIAEAGSPATVLFLGDNVYPGGLPDRDDPDYHPAETALRTQVEFLDSLTARGIFIPGNHDWQHWGKKGLEHVLNQQAWIDSLQDSRITFLPRQGCPGPVEIPLDSANVLIIIDSQWFLHRWEKTVDADICAATTPVEALAILEDMFSRNEGKRIVVAAHHPLITYGEHGGIFTWKAHIFPLEEMTKYLYVPLPGIGSIYPLYRRWFGHVQDTPHPLYKQVATALQKIMHQYPGTLHVAGHEHGLQYIVKDSTHYVVSGSGAKTEYIRQKEHAVFADDIRGFARVSLLTDGRVRIVFVQADDDFPEGREVFETMLAPQPPATEGPAGTPVLPDSVTARASSQYVAGKWKARLFGNNYRRAWSQPVEVPVFDLGAARGGMKILQRGGGQQTLSLRLADSSGHEYVLRSVEKFPEAAIPEILRGTFAQDLVQDQISASHPYAALVVAPLAQSVNLYHTRPRVVFVPDDPRFREYRKTFANTLALFEERPDGDWSEAGHFGNADKIISTRKVLEKLIDDNDNRVDEKFVLRNRLFDLIIGDWDRHDDQWRWAAFGKKNNETYRPIPRDRDQAFFVNEGLLAKIWSRRWALPKFEGFNDDIRWPSGLSFNARHFDRSFLTGLSKDDWIQAARDLKDDLSDEEIESAVRHWPRAIFRLDGEQVISKLKARRDNIVEDALSHYGFLARDVDVTGTDKTEAFVVERLANGDVHVIVRKISKKGERDDVMYDRTFEYGETKEIRLYGMDGDDVFEISGESSRSILVRIIGGEGEDILSDESHVKGLSRKTIFYDQAGQAMIRNSGEVREMISSDPDVNEYDRTANEYDRVAPLVYGQYNFDDGIFVGAGFLLINHGFRKEPFRQRHLFLANVAPLTRSYNFRYAAKFTRAVAKWDLELDADVKAPNYVNNFFGMGNESVFRKDIGDDPAISVSRAIQYYRYRFQEVALYPSLSRLVGNWGSVKLGPFYQRVEMEDPGAGASRFISGYAGTLPGRLFDEGRAWMGARWEAQAGRRNDGLLTRRGTDLRLSGRHLAGVGAGVADFSSYEGSLAFFHSEHTTSRLVMAARVGAGVNTGEYPFYQAQVLGGHNAVRGYRKTRFYGDSMFFTNAELRLRLADIRSYLFPASVGILGFYDVGRIWYKNENGIDPSASDGDSDNWHRGWGGGLWFTPFNLTVLSAEAGHSREGTMVYLRMGFLF